MIEGLEPIGEKSEKLPLPLWAIICIIIAFFGIVACLISFCIKKKRDQKLRNLLDMYNEEEDLEDYENQENEDKKRKKKRDPNEVDLDDY